MASRASHSDKCCPEKCVVWPTLLCGLVGDPQVFSPDVSPRDSEQIRVERPWARPGESVSLSPEPQERFLQGVLRIEG
jgi:hypothetical protein